MAATRAKPPPPDVELRGRQLFQTIDELHVRHGNLPATKDRLTSGAEGSWSDLSCSAPST
jgi:hypothetical protein